MSTTTSHARFLRLIDREVLRGLPREGRERLHDHLRGCASCRAHHDRLHDGFRVLEGEPLVSQTELAQLERWVVEALPASAPRRFRLFSWLAPALLAALVAVVLLRPVSLPAHVLALTAKGGAGPAVLAVEVLCGPRPEALHPAVPEGCRLDETLAFAYRARPDRETPQGRLTLFGIDAQRRARYYAPTPVDAGAVDVAQGPWRAAPISVRLTVNHAAGRLQVFALLSPQAPSVADIDAFAAALADRPPDADAPWHRSLGSPGAPSLHTLCGPMLDACHSARLDLTLSEPSTEENR